MRMQDLADALGTPRRAFPTALAAGAAAARVCKNAGSDNPPKPADAASRLRRLKRRIVRAVLVAGVG